jgi:hypothetical protein
MFDPALLPHLEAPVTYTLDNGVELYDEFPDTFDLPSEAERTTLRPGDFAKLIFRMTNGEKVAVERMWVRVLELRPQGYVGALANKPYCTEAITIGMRVGFSAAYVIQVRRGEAVPG